MFLYYQKQNDLLCDIFKPVDSITVIASCDWDKFHYSVIVRLLLIIVLTTFIFKRL